MHLLELDPLLLADMPAPTNVLDVETSRLWSFLPIGYAITVLIEVPILYFGLSKRHSTSRRLALGFWLTACTYPIVVLVLPTLMVRASFAAYLIVAETFAPLAECILFRLVDTPAPASTLPIGIDDPPDSPSRLRDYAVIIVANLASFLTGLLLADLGIL